MNTKTLIASLAFGLVSGNALAVEASRVNVPITSLERTAVRSEIATFDATGQYGANEAYGSFTYDALHGAGSALSRADVVAEMRLPQWQALMAAKSDSYNSFGGWTATGTSLAKMAGDATFASAAQARDYSGG